MSAPLDRVPYHGSAPLNSDLLAGAVDVAFDLTTTSIPHIRAGSLHPLGVTTAEPVPQLPEVRTLQAQGLPDSRVVGWNSMLVPARTPPEVIEKLGAACGDFLALDSTRAVLDTLGMTRQSGGPAGVARRRREEAAFWTPIIRSAEITPD